jgi:dephospho-CoA kinase
MSHGPRIPVIGLTGAIAAGKSAVAAELRSLGAAVFDADAEVATLLDRPEIVERIGAEIGEEAVRENAVDRRTVARIVFQDEHKRRRLEEILHPPVIAAAEVLIADPPAGARAVVLDVPLLIEAGMDELCNEVWFVDAPREVRERRAIERRGWSAGELERREAAQLSVETKRDRADRVIENASDLDTLANAVRSAWAAALRESG